MQLLMIIILNQAHEVTLVFSGVGVAQSLVFCVLFLKIIVGPSFFLRLLYYLSFFYLHLTPLYLQTFLYFFCWNFTSVYFKLFC
jgi:hypothetical protein